MHGLYLLYLNKIYLNTWTLVGGAIWESYGTFRRYSHAGGSSALGASFESLYRFVPFLAVVSASCVRLKCGQSASYSGCLLCLPHHYDSPSGTRSQNKLFYESWYFYHRTEK